MSAPVCQFVDRVGTGAVTRLNLNDGKKLRLLDPNFSPPALKRAVVNTLMAEGAFIPASAYDNRVIRLPLRVKACNETEMATILEGLHRELDRGQNILKWHPTYNSRPVYFRTFRSPDYRLDQTVEGRGELNATLTILAEPFAYGDVVESTGTIYNDPVAVANGLFFEIAATEGDVPTPLYIYMNPALLDIVLAVRRHGTPALYFAQAEALVQGVDTTLQAFDALMSGPGQNFSQTTFATATWQTRLTWDLCPAAGASAEYRGLYRVFVRIRRSDNTSDIDVRMNYGPVLGIDGPIVTTPKNTVIQLLDLGLLPIPPTPDPVYDGFSGEILPVEHIRFRLQAQRTAGTGQLDWDYVVLVPADEELALFFGQGAPGTIVDGPNDLIFPGDMVEVSASLNLGFGFLIGSLPLVSPDQTNRYFMLLGIGTNAIADTTSFTARYWPRHLYIR